ncbi:MAG: methylmalonyl-CoA epimerase [Anaerolineae bacterium]
MCKKVHHIGIVVKDLEEAVRDYAGMLGVAPGGTHEVPKQGVRVAFFPVGESRIELVQPTDPESGVSRFLEKRGEGIHHLCLEVEDIRATLADLKAKGVRLIDEEPRQGAEGLVAFVHPASMHGVLLELVQVTHEETPH